MLDESDREDEVLMPCDHPGCARESTHSRAVWVTPGHMKVEYYCPEHAPAGATTFEEDDEPE
jgi:hypothetical protein